MGNRGKTLEIPGKFVVVSGIWKIGIWFFSGFLLGYLEYVNGILEHVIYVSTTRNRGRMM